jgi:O-6-methylguanine DNA methyltransferase
MTRGSAPDAQCPHQDDFLTAGLAALATKGPPGLLERIAASWVRVPGPVCDLYVASTDRGVVYVRTSDAVHDDEEEFATLFHHRFTRPLVAATDPPGDLLSALRDDRLERIRFDLSQLSAFEREVLLAVLTIPRGQVRPYGWIAHRVGHPATVHSVDIVLTHNPIPVLIPCHRVIHDNGTPGDYVFGQPMKRTLLAAEGTNLDQAHPHPTEPN